MIEFSVVEIWVRHSRVAEARLEARGCQSRRRRKRRRKRRSRRDQRRDMLLWRSRL